MPSLFKSGQKIGVRPEIFSVTYFHSTNIENWKKKKEIGKKNGKTGLLNVPLYVSNVWIIDT